MNDKRPLTSLQSRRGQQMNTSQSQSTFFNRPQTAGGGSQENQDYNARNNPQSNFSKINFNSNTQTQKELGFVNSSNQQNMNQSQRLPTFKSTESDLQLKDMSKMIPKNIYQDKERLYEELITTKKFVNQLKFDNHKLQTNCYFLKDKQEFIASEIIFLFQLLKQQELKKYETEVSPDQVDTINLLSKIKKKPKQVGIYNKEISSIIPNLKQQLVEVQSQLKQKETEMSTLKRNVKLTKISELEVELKSYMDETIRLRRLLQQSLSLRRNDQDEGDGSVEEKFITQINQILNLKSENQKHLESNEELKIKLIEKDKQLKEMERQSQKITKDKAYYKRLLVEKERELDRQRGVDPEKKTSSRKSIGASEGQFKIELERKISDCNNLNTKIQEKEKKISDLEQKIKDLQTDYQEKLSVETKEKESLRLKNEKEHQELVELKEKYDQLLPIKRNKDRKMETTRTNVGNSGEFNSFGPDTPQHRSEFAITPSQQQMRKRLTLANHDLLPLCNELKFRLRQKKISYSDIDQYLTTHGLVHKQYANQDDLKIIFRNEPFCITNEDDLHNLSRFLSEDSTNQTEENIFNEEINKGSKVSVIKNQFKKLIGFYTVYSQENHPEQFHEIQRFIADKEEQIKTHFSHENLQHVQKSKLESFMKFNDASLDSALLDFIYQSINYINLEHIFKKFGGYQSPKSKFSDLSPVVNHDKMSSNKDDNFFSKKDTLKSNNQYTDSVKEDNPPIQKRLTDLNKLHSFEDSSKGTPRSQGEIVQNPNVNYQQNKDSDQEYQTNSKKNDMSKIEEEDDAGTPMKSHQKQQENKHSQFKKDEINHNQNEVEF